MGELYLGGWRGQEAGEGEENTILGNKGAGSTSLLGDLERDIFLLGGDIGFFFASSLGEKDGERGATLGLRRAF